MLLDLVRFCVGVSFLGYAAYRDWTERSVPNGLWIVMGVIGGGLLVAQFLLGGYDLLCVCFIPLTWLLAYLLYALHLWGGADAKGLMALAVLVPSWPSVPPLRSLLPFPFVILCNTALALIFVPVVLAMYNGTRGDLVFPQCFLSIRRREMEDRGGEVKGEGKEWVKPEIPFMVPLLAGFVVSFSVGDLLYALFRALGSSV